MRERWGEYLAGTICSWVMSGGMSRNKRWENVGECLGGEIVRK